MRYPDRGLYGTVNRDKKSGRQRQHRAWVIWNNSKYGPVPDLSPKLRTLYRRWGDRPTYVLTEGGTIDDGVNKRQLYPAGQRYH
jgi:hypothetical protein